MPKGCGAVTLNLWGDGQVEVIDQDGDWKVVTAIPVPLHEGALVDRAALWVEICKICDRRDAGLITDLTCLQQIMSTLRHAPTIIPASEEGE